MPYRLLQPLASRKIANLVLCTGRNFPNLGLRFVTRLLPLSHFVIPNFSMICQYRTLNVFLLNWLPVSLSKLFVTNLSHVCEWDCGPLIALLICGFLLSVYPVVVLYCKNPYNIISSICEFDYWPYSFGNCFIDRSSFVWWCWSFEAALFILGTLLVNYTSRTSCQGDMIF